MLIKIGLLVYFIICLILFSGELKKAPLKQECNFCRTAVPPNSLKYMKKEGYSPMATCPQCESWATEQGFKIYKVSGNKEKEVD